MKQFAAQPTPGWQWVREEFERGQIRYVVLKDGGNYILSPNFNHHGGTWINVDDDHAALIASAPALAAENARLITALERATDNLGDAADRLHKIAECLNALGGEGFENSATQVLAAAGIVRQYEAAARVALAQEDTGQ